MNYMYKYFKKYKKETVLAPLFKMLEASFELCVPIVVARMIDIGIANNDFAYLIKSGLVLLLLAIIGFTCSIIAQYFSAKVAVGVGCGIRHSLFAHLLSFSFKRIDNVGTDTMITRMTSDINSVQNGVNMVLRLFLRSPFIIVGAVVMAFTLDFQMGLVFIGVVVLLSTVIFGSMIINIPLLKRVQEGIDSILRITRENLTGIRVIRAFCMERNEEHEFSKNNDILVQAQKRGARISTLINPITYVIVNIGIVLILWVGAFKVNTGNLTDGDVVALYNYMAQILIELIKLANLIISVNKAMASSKRIEEVFKLKSADEEENQLSTLIDKNVNLTNNGKDDKVIDKTSSIKFTNVSLTYDGAGAPALTDIDFDISKGQTLGIIGGTGSGKTSLVHLISGFYKNTTGYIKIDGKEIEDYQKEQLRQKIGIVMQKAVLFKGTIKENILVGNENATDKEIEEAINIAQAKDVVESKGGLMGEINQGGTNLSGGQRQRLSVARALVKKPDILIMDDSSSALDFATDAKLRQAINRLDYNPTVVIVSQRAASVQNADVILVLDDGKLISRGTHQNLLETCEVYKEIYYSQFTKEAE